MNETTPLVAVPNKSTSNHHTNRKHQYYSTIGRSRRFLLLICIGIIVFICIVVIFVRSSLIVLHKRYHNHPHYQYPDNHYYHSHHHSDHQDSKLIIAPSNDDDQQHHGIDNVNDTSSCCCTEDTSTSSASSSSSSSSCMCTFHQLGKTIIPIAYQKMMDSLQTNLFIVQPNDANSNDNHSTIYDNNNYNSNSNNNNTTVLQPPSNVEVVRKHILHIRDLFDIFSPIFINNATTSITDDVPPDVDENNNDLWLTIRNQLDIGYTIIGQYQDFDHSHISSTTISIQELDTIQNQIIQWYNHFISSSTQTIISSLSISDDNDTTWYIHAMESHLFWNHPIHQHTHHYDVYGTEYTTNDDAIFIIQVLLRKQITIAQKYYTKAYTHISVYENHEQMDYHNLRKVLRSIINVYDTFTSSQCPLLIIQNPNPEAQYIIQPSDVDIFNTARQMLGDLNDDWNAYNYYMKHTTTITAGNHHHHNHHHANNKNYITKMDTLEYTQTVSRLMTNIDIKWNTFKTWSVNDTHNLFDTFDRILLHRSQ